MDKMSTKKLTDNKSPEKILIEEIINCFSQNPDMQLIVGAPGSPAQLLADIIKDCWRKGAISND